jgi:hypothetical protein
VVKKINMILQSQKDPKWAKQTIGTCKDTFAQSGCKITCFSMIAGITPSEVNKKITYTNGCLTVDERNAKELGLEYGGRTTKKPQEICIAETNKYAPKIPQHFFLINPQTDEMADPLDYPCVWKKNKYPIVSYRLIFNKNETMKIPQKFKDELEKTQDELKGKKEYEKEVKHKFKDELREEDVMIIKELMSGMRNLYNDQKAENGKLKKLVEDTNKANEDLIKEKRQPIEVVKEKIVFQDSPETLEEITRLKALVEKNAKDTSILDALSFLLKSIINR